MAIVEFDGEIGNLAIDFRCSHVPVTPPPAARQQVALPRQATRQSNPKKVALIDDLFPLIHDLSEQYLDQFGDRTASWSEQFIAGRAAAFFDRASVEFQSVLQKFDELRPLIQRHRVYSDIYELDEAIVSRLNAIPHALAEARAISEKLSHRFDDKSLSLVADKMDAFRKAIGTLRTYLSRTCLERLTKIRSEAGG